MTKTVKIIELLNMISKGEEVPKKIKYCGEEFQFTGYDSASKNYINEFEDLFEILDGSMLNDEVETLKEPKKIPEKLEEFDIQGLEVSGYSMTQAEYLLENGVKENREMINWILDYLKTKGE